MKTTEEPIVVVQSIAAPVEDVWSAITEKDQMVQWFFDNIPEFQPEVGFSTEFQVTNEGRTFTHCWKVVRAVPHQVVEYQWNYREYQGDSLVTFELTPEGSTTQIKLTHAATEDFDDSVPEFQRESGVNGWNYLISERLKIYLEN